MRLSVSTMTCPDWDLPTIVDVLSGSGIHAVDFRGLGGSMKLWEHPLFGRERLRDSLSRIEDGGLTVSGISTSVRLAETSKGPSLEEMLDEGRRSIEMAGECGGEYIRVMGGSLPGEFRQREAAVDRMSAALAALCRHAAGSGVAVLVETHDDLSASPDMAAVIDGAERSEAGVIWDVRHPAHLAGESLTETAQTLGSRIGGVHLKDFRASGDFPLVTFGTGDLDPEELLGALQTVGYDGYLILEQPRVLSTGNPAPNENIAGFLEAFGKYGRKERNRK
jgi:sugar phosphate isomerase/epimerase